MSNGWYTMPLQSKVSTTLVLLITAFIVLSYVVLRTVIAPAFDDLEHAAAEADMKRTEGALQTDLDNLAANTADWAPWDDIHDYARGQNPGFVKSNLDRPTLENLGLDLLAIVSLDKQLLWGMALADGRELDNSTFGILDADNPKSRGLVSHDEIDARTLGLVNTVHGPMLISSMPILRSDENGPIAGAVIMGQFLNDSRLQRLRERTGVDIDWAFNGEDAQYPDEVLYKYSDKAIKLCIVLREINGAPFLILQSSTPRSITALGSQTITVALLFLVSAGLMVSAFIWFMLRRAILRPLERLTTHVDDLRTSGDLSRQIGMRRGDEIGVLARQFDSMTAEVHEARQALLDQSFKAGKADTAAEVLHNIRNAMTPMINGLDRLKRAFKVTERLRVVDAIDQVSDPQCPPERKSKFLQYIQVSFETLVNAGSEAVEDLKLVTAQAKQVEGILSDQERFANVAPVAETLLIDELLDEASNVIPPDESESVAVKMEDDVRDIAVTAHRIGLLQVMGNLILNAYELIKRSGRSTGEILLQASDVFVDDQKMVRVTVRDNGNGFDEETGKQIFQRGFTSKTRGEYKGLGLHWCANAVASMGGRITAVSDGHGEGAEFHVLLPAAQGG